jgi:hypothetical protein
VPSTPRPAAALASAKTVREKSLRGPAGFQARNQTLRQVVSNDTQCRTRLKLARRLRVNTSTATDDNFLAIRHPPAIRFDILKTPMYAVLSRAFVRLWQSITNNGCARDIGAVRFQIVDESGETGHVVQNGIAAGQTAGISDDTSIETRPVKKVEVLGIDFVGEEK